MGLISVGQLAALINGDGDDVVICDVRFMLTDHDQGRREYDEAHIPGAVFVDLHTDLADTSQPNAGRHPLPDVADFASLLGSLGVTASTMVVAYDSAGGAIAARLWWMLRSIGHTRAAVLDGGYQAWVGAGQPVTAEVPAPTETKYRGAPAWTGILDADSVAQGIEFGGTVVDSRSADRFRGDNEPIDPRAGHIPGAINIPHDATIGSDGLHLSTAELLEHFADVGERPVVYCGSGVTACHNLLAMSLVGIHEARLYPGSWSEWSSDPTREVATGE